MKRAFSADAIDQRWCGDLTEIPTDEGKLYLATVLDLASRRLPGFAMSGHHDSALAKAALCMAAAVRGGDIDAVIFDHRLSLGSTRRPATPTGLPTPARSRRSGEAHKARL